MSTKTFIDTKLYKNRRRGSELIVMYAEFISKSVFNMKYSTLNVVSLSKKDYEHRRRGLESIEVYAFVTCYLCACMCRCMHVCARATRLPEVR